MPAYKIQTYRVRLVKDRQISLRELSADCYENASAILMALLKDLPHEEVHLLLLNVKTEVIGSVQVSMGGVSSSALTARDVLRPVVASGATAFIMGHNHPSGDPKPSSDDYAMTRAVQRAADLIGTPLLDHIVVCPQNGKSQSCLEPAMFSVRHIEEPPLNDEVLSQIREAAALGESVALVGRVGCGATLAARYYSQLRATSARDCEDARRMASLIGAVLDAPPFRAPHHSVSTEGICGNANRPGEYDLAAGGTLFLDDLVEFRKAAIDSLAARMPRPGFNAVPRFVASHHPIGSQFEARNRERFEERCKLLGITRTIVL